MGRSLARETSDVSQNVGCALQVAPARLDLLMTFSLEGKCCRKRGKRGAPWREVRSPAGTTDSSPSG